MQFHENFKRIANERGTSPTAVLQDMGVATSKIAAWNKGMLPKQDMLVKLAEYLHCSVMDFFWDEKDEQALHEASEPKDEDEVDILTTYRKLSRRDKHEFMSMVYDFDRRCESAGDKEVSGR